MRCPTLRELPPPPSDKTGWPWTQENQPLSDTMHNGLPWPRVSIVTPSYNQGGFLEETIRSILLQGYPDLEYLVIDGGSTDNSIDILRKYDKWLSYWVSEPDNGQSHAIKKGFLQSTGSILAWLNSDDLYLPGALQTAATELNDEQRYDVVYGNMYRIDASGHIFGERRYTPFTRLGYLYGGCSLPQPATFWRKEIYLKVGGIDTDFMFSLDTELFVRFVLAGGRFNFVRRFVACFRGHPNSKTSTISHIGDKERSKIRASYLSFPFESLRGACIRKIVKGQRFIRYILQGDLIWLLGRMAGRIGKI